MTPNLMLWEMIPNNLFRINIKDWENLLESAWKMGSQRMSGCDAGRNTSGGSRIGMELWGRPVQCISVSRKVKSMRVT